MLVAVRKILLAAVLGFLFGLPMAGSAASCCECVPPTFNPNAIPPLGRTCVDKQENVSCETVCPNYGPAPYPREGSFCDANHCPISIWAGKGTCVWTNQSGQKLCISASNEFGQYECLHAVNASIVKRDFYFEDASKIPECAVDIPMESTPANQEDIKPKNSISFSPQVTIPGSITIGGKEITFKKGEGVEITGSTAAQYFAVFYRFFVAALAVAAIVMVMWGGFKRIMAAGSPEKIKSANETIMGAITGVVIGLISYSLLSLINPALVSLKSLDLTAVKREDLDFGGDLPGPVELCPNPQQLRGEAAANEIINYAVDFVDKVTYHLGAKSGRPCGEDKSKICGNGKYRSGGQVCFDCSGFVSYVYKCVTGLEVPSFSNTLMAWQGNAEIVRVTNVADLMPGDIYGWGQASSGGNTGHVLLVKARSNNQPSSSIEVRGVCTVNGAGFTGTIRYGTLANKCLGDPQNVNRCFYLHLKREGDFSVACETGGSNVPCGLRSPQGRCTYREFDEYAVEGLSGKYKVGRLSGGCKLN